jgi:hypothetical protein
MRHIREIHMTDELDPQLLRWFAAAEQSLPAAGFTTRIAAAQRRERWLRTPWRIGLSVMRATAAALAVTFQRHPGFSGLAALAGLAIALGLALQG